jgi:hypothetical protein
MGGSLNPDGNISQYSINELENLAEINQFRIRKIEFCGNLW